MAGRGLGAQLSTHFRNGNKERTTESKKTIFQGNNNLSQEREWLIPKLSSMYS